MTPLPPGATRLPARADDERRARSVWVEVVDRRRAWHAKDGDTSMETWPAYDAMWRDRLDDVVDIAADASQGRNEVDVRAALVDVMAVCAAWIDRMGEPNGG